MSAPIDISLPQLTHGTDTKLWRLEAEVDGQCVYFQSAHPLNNSSDVFACAFFLIASQLGRPLRMAGPVDAALAENLKETARIAKRYWGFDGPSPMMETATAINQGGDTGIFFTCGVDSFCTLKRNITDVRHLINVHGFDIGLKDVDRYQKSLHGLNSTADSLGLNLISVETNLREHPLFGALNWEITHGAALAAVGHSLAGHLNVIRIAGSDVPPPWGSTPELDNLWSSSRLALINNEPGLKRIDKVSEIAHWSPVRDQLKVCWENLAESLNCGHCEKCVRTQVSLSVFDALEESTSFPPGDLVDRINALPYVKSSLVPQWVDLQARITTPKERQAIDRLLWRSAILNPMRTLSIKLRLGPVKRLLKKLYRAPAFKALGR